MARKKYENGYLEKIQYWTDRYSKECDPLIGSVDNQKRILEKIQFFIGKQHEYLNAKVEESIETINNSLNITKDFND